jgi:hypothetical protein
MERHKILRNLSITAFLVGISLFSGMYWANKLDFLIFDATGELRTDGIFGILSPIMFQAKTTLIFGWYYGIPLALLGILGIIATHAKWNVEILEQHRMGFAAIGVALVSHILVLVQSAQFFFIPAGTDVRPMGWALMMAVIAIGTFLVVVPTAVVAIVKESPRLVGIVALILGLTPFWLPGLILRIAARTNEFNLSP